MNNRQNDVIISGINIELTDTMKSIVREKVARLFLHEDNIIRIRVDLEDDQTHPERRFIAKGMIEIRGPRMVTTATSDDVFKSIDIMTDRLDRMLRRRSRLMRVKRKQPRAVDIPAQLPKVAMA